MKCVSVCSASSAVSSADVHNVSKPTSTAIHEQMFRLIAINNKMRKSRLGHIDSNEGRTLLSITIVTPCCQSALQLPALKTE